MTYQLIGDRFLADGSKHWIDLATGAVVNVVIHSLDEAWERVERRLHEERRARRTRWPRLVEFGRVNEREWFEARSMRRHAVSGRPAVAGRTAAQHLVSLTEAGAEGMRHVRILGPAAGFITISAAIAAAVRPLGYVTLRADVRLEPGLAEELAHRHLVLLYRSTANRAPVVRWIRRLASLSPRAHVVVELHNERAFWFNVFQFPVAAWHEHVARTCADANALMTAARLEQAEALLAALDAEAFVRGVQPPDTLSMSWVKLRSCQGRIEEARKRLAALSMNRGVRERDHTSAARHSSLASVRARR